MGSEHNDNSTSYKPSEPKPCANNCGFFGTAGNRNLCSKCYRDLCVQEQRAASANADVDKTLFHGCATSASSPSQETLHSAVPSAAPSSSAGLPSGTAAASNRCGSCNKKVGLTGFVCKCGTTFCSVHRYPEKHDCSYDFKGSARDAISKANPVVKADKVERF